MHHIPSRACKSAARGPPLRTGPPGRRRALTMTRAIRCRSLRDLEDLDDSAVEKTDRRELRYSTIRACEESARMAVAAWLGVIPPLDSASNTVRPCAACLMMLLHPPPLYRKQVPPAAAGKTKVKNMCESRSWLGLLAITNGKQVSKRPCANTHRGTSVAFDCFY
jgi:hypothetical protein